ncbi:heavy metal translocating P-type ATPase [Intrasporangium sp. YIM S08009]|uniref:heavy metal translocating P-type ATPase n=1 Tax=Intrasporangium zincisolvens TaxID=3080018 RepID=UPI002B052769|nr:heavy metal translocating P-type ATPase [Intrasporangium sp. YIM S08009]
MRWRRRVPTLFFLASAGLLGGGAIVAVAGLRSGNDAWAEVARALWLAATVLGLVVSCWTTARALVARRASVDVVAVLALAGALWVGETFAGAMITLMLASGQLLEARAAARADRDLRLLVERTPRTARRRGATAVDVVPVEQVLRGDVLVVGTGEVVPVDGRVLGPASLDESALTGEPMPVEHPAGDDVRSGVVNAGPPVDLVATTLAADSTYAHVVRLVEQAQAASAPLVRTADRFAALFVPFTLLVAGLAWWLGGTPVRAVAVLVVATPCPLLLAAPVAVMSGVSRAARIGVVVKGGAALEGLAAGQVMLFDKTGTLTHGRPEVTSVVVPPPESGAGTDASAQADVVRLAASLDQVSPHPLASAVVGAARARGLPLTLPTDVREVHGYGLEGRVEDHVVRLGKASWTVGEDVPGWVAQARRRATLDGCLTVFASVDGRPAGVFLLEDPIREDAPRMLTALHEAGIERTVLVTGDRHDVAETVGRVVGVDAVLADHDPAAKLAAIRDESAHARTIMVGDGVNDAPALAAAGVGVALAARGATASSEAADVVLTVDRVDRLADAILIARRSRRIALEAVVVGMGLSVVAMGAAAAGLLAPAAGAVLQEAIDVLAIAIALRVLLPGRMHTVSMSDADVATARRLRERHEVALVAVESIRTVADGLDRHDPDIAPVVALLARLERDLVPHERADEDELMPIVTRALGAPAARGLRRTHAEIEQQVGRLRRLLDDVTDAGRVRPEDVTELRRLLYGLYAVCRLHNAQEEEGAFALVPHTAGTPAAQADPTPPRP